MRVRFADGLWGEGAAFLEGGRESAGAEAPQGGLPVFVGLKRHASIGKTRDQGLPPVVGGAQRPLRRFWLRQNDGVGGQDDGWLGAVRVRRGLKPLGWG